MTMRKIILPNRRLLRPTRRAFIAGAAALMATPHVAKSQLALTSVGGGFGAGGGLDPDTAAWVAGVVSAGGTVSGGRQTLVNTMIVGLKSDGVWTLLDRLWIFAGENTQSALLDMKSLVTATNNSCTFTTDRGYVGGASGQYIDTGFIPSSAGGSFTQNSATLGCYALTAPSSGFPVLCGTNDGTNSARIDTAHSGGFTVVMNGSAGYFPGSTNAGIIVASRTGASAGATYQNGSSIGTDSTSSAGLPTTKIAFCANGPSGGIAGSDGITGMGMLGGGMNATQAANFTTRIQTYMTAVGA